MLAATVSALIMVAGPASAAATPTVKEVEPDTGPAAGATPVTLKGTNFTGTTAVRFGSKSAASFTVNSATSITAVSPALTSGSAIVDVTVTTPEGTSPITTNSTPFSESDLFYYEPAVTGVAPNNGPATGGTPVTITGIGLNATFKRGAPPPCWVCTVSFGAHEASGREVGFESVRAVSPAGTGTVDVTVSTSLGGTSPTSSADRFTYASTNPTPHYYRSGTLIPEGERVPILEWGVLSRTPVPAGSPATCENAGGGFVENPIGGGAGVGQTTNFSSYNCAFAGCPPGKVTVEGKEYEKEFTVDAQSLPWPSTLVEEEGIRINSTNVEIVLGCVAHGLSNTSPPGGTELGKPGVQEQFYLAGTTGCVTTPEKQQKPLAVNGKNTTITSKIEFDAKAGAMSCAGGAVEGKTSGKLKVMGYKESEVITVKTP